MKNLWGHGSWCLVATTVVGLVLSGCGGAGDEAARGEVDSESGGSISVALISVPAATACVRFTVTPATGTATVKTFTVTANAAATYQVGPLAPGAYTVSGDSFSQACSAIGTNVGTYIADAVPLTLRAGAATNLTLTFRKNAPINVSANFLNNVQHVTTTGTSTYVITDGGLLGAGWISVTTGFSKLALSAFDASVAAGNAVKAIAGFNNGACAARVDGTVWCWGASYYGELGPAVAVGSSSWTPVQVPNLSNATLITGGGAHVCATATHATQGRGTFCWGANESGQLGNGTITTSSTPVRALSGEARSLSASNSTTLAVGPLGDAYAWGYNGYGGLGNGNTTNATSPLYIRSGAQAVAAGAIHSCVLLVDGSVICAGYNGYGQLGDGTTTNRLSLTLVNGLNARQLTASYYGTCALATDGQTWCWGMGVYGANGNGKSNDQLTPSKVNLNGVTLASLADGGGTYHQCGTATTLDVYCWGANLNGALGDGTSNAAFVPVRAVLQ